MWHHHPSHHCIKPLAATRQRHVFKSIQSHHLPSPHCLCYLPHSRPNCPAQPCQPCRRPPVWTGVCRHRLCHLSSFAVATSTFLLHVVLCSIQLHSSHHYQRRQSHALIVAPLQLLAAASSFPPPLCCSRVGASCCARSHVSVLCRRPS